MGRKTKLTPELQEKILLHIRAGNYIRTACMAVGISEQDYFNWVKWGEQRRKGVFFEFFKAVKKAEAEAEARLVTIVNLAGPSNWQAAMTMLERKYPDRWGKRERHDVDLTSGGQPLKAYIGISPEDWDKEEKDRDGNGSS